jgi:hypothetical protein
LQAVATLLNSNPKHRITRQVAAALVVLMPLMLVEFPLLPFFPPCTAGITGTMEGAFKRCPNYGHATFSFWRQFCTEFFFLTRA